MNSTDILRSRFVDFDESFRRILPIVLPPVDPICPPNTSLTPSGGLFSLSDDEE